MVKLPVFTLILSLYPLIAFSQPLTYPPDIPDARVETYKTAGEVGLKLWIFTPIDHSDKDSRPAIVFFFGGGWRAGSPSHFERHCRYLADRGMVAVAADYRVKSRHNVTIDTCVADAKSAMRWVRNQSSRLGIDPDRIAAGGGSAGGHLAAATAILPGLDDPTDDMSVSAKPNALVLFNPATVLAPIDSKTIRSSIPVPNAIQSKMSEYLSSDAGKERMGVEPSEVSPFHHLTHDICPTIIFHGTADKTVSYFSAELFSAEMREYGNRCELVGYEGLDHGFFNFGRGENAAFIDTIFRMDKFLISLGYLNNVPETVVSR